MLLCLPVVVGVGGHLISPSSSVALLLLSINMLNSIASHRTPSTQTTIPICLFVSLCVSFPSIPHSRCLAKVLPHLLLPKSNPRFLFSTHAFFIGGPSCCLPALVVEQEDRDGGLQRQLIGVGGHGRRGTPTTYSVTLPRFL